MKKPNTVTVPLTRGRFAIVDANDEYLVSNIKWQARYSKGNWYAIHSTTDGEETMHTLILGNIDGFEIDHVNQNGLDNRRTNLRHATKSQNRANVSLRKDNKSGYKGVSLLKSYGKWRAYIQKDKKLLHLGFFDTPQEAAIAYNKKAKELFGEFAWLNQIP